jgi:hypothetical protein
MQKVFIDLHSCITALIRQKNRIREMLSLAGTPTIRETFDVYEGHPAAIPTNR